MPVENLDFKQWLDANEGILDTAKSWGKRAAVGAALMGGGMGIQNYMNQPTQPDNPQAWQQKYPGKVDQANHGDVTIQGDQAISIGRAPIRKALGEAKGKELARDKAILNAKTKIIQQLGKKNTNLYGVQILKSSSDGNFLTVTIKCFTKPQAFTNQIEDVDPSRYVSELPRQQISLPVLQARLRVVKHQIDQLERVRQHHPQDERIIHALDMLTVELRKIESSLKQVATV